MPALYRDPHIDQVGIWGDPTSTLDWCEENYVVTKYVAEFWNTITNYFMVVPPLLTAIRFYKTGVDARFVMSFLSVVAIGIGSTLFHATLLYKMQLLDELPMIYCTYIILYCVLTCNDEPHKKTFYLKFFLTISCVIVTLIYLIVVNPLVFQWAYGLSVAVLIVATNYSARKYNVPLKFSILALICYGFGFILWNIDNEFCIYVRYFRGLLPWPFNTVGQLHAWWHCFAAFGGYFQILFTIELRMICRRRKHKWKMNGSHQNGGTEIQQIGSDTILSFVIRDVCCCIPIKDQHLDAEYRTDNNNVFINGNYEVLKS
ncbi:alkaline ceramidase 3-like [Xenia sp. Carnegie-2017]|uniref:alkaline ceramidase 3-like n=1 Tax=Xenia sp. Carnegie-2017 TaxID=2897299 RepID=UPI001F03A2A6|nr:alkaline ceramidase 3-like [Xenia sp. Carnegie-2017]